MRGNLQEIMQEKWENIFGNILISEYVGINTVTYPSISLITVGKKDL